jgi:hypothetical protein
MRHAEGFGERLARQADIDPDDQIGAGEPRALDDVEPGWPVRSSAAPTSACVPI